MVKMEIASTWWNKEGAVKEAAYYRKHGIPARAIKAPGHRTAWNCWVDSHPKHWSKR
jgi:hypothetical protein